MSDRDNTVKAEDVIAGRERANRADVYKDANRKTVVNEYADSKEYFSWEEFYTSYLVSVTQGTIYRYGKSKLAKAYKTEGACKRIVAELPEQIRPE